jgi:hypothetical protein
VVATFSPNRNLVTQQQGVDTLWGTTLNNALITYLDNILGNTEPISISVADVTLTTNQWNNCAISLTGALTGHQNLILPFVTGSSTTAVGGLFVVENNTTGIFNVSVITQAPGSTGVPARQGLRTWLYSDGTNVWYADDASVHIIPNSGNPNGIVPGTAGSNNAPPSVVWDYTNSVLYFCTTTGTSVTAIWTNAVAAGAPLPTPQGYLTLVSNTPIITSDTINVIVYYTPYVGTWAAVHNGSGIVAYQFSQMQLTLSPSQAANNIYDVYLAYNSGTPVIGTGPSWVAGAGGSITAGSCARGTGAGGSAVQRATPSGLWVNVASISLIYNTGGGNNTITVPSGQGIYLGTIYIDGIAGQISCHRSYGLNRKFGIWNAYNQAAIELVSGDSNVSWPYIGTALRASQGAPAAWSSTVFNTNSGTSANGMTILQGLPDIPVEATFSQNIFIGSTGSFTITVQNAIGLNSVTTASGQTAISGAGSGMSAFYSCNNAHFSGSLSVGINTLCSLEAALNGAASNWQGTQSNMQMTARYRG